MSKVKGENFRSKYRIISKIVFFLVYVFVFLSIIFLWFLYYFDSLWPFPDVREYKTIPIPESSVIYDRNWVELYKIYSEKRTYVAYENINANMINAIVAWEDKRFWTHPGYDGLGILRAIYNWIINWEKFTWTSWINQQLAKITYLSNERTLDRKIKELYLSIELDNIFEKKDILELYLNKVFFWWNSYGIEQASQTYFWTWANDLWIIESSILASLPKSPSSLSPYSNKAELLGYPLISYMDSETTNTKILSKKELEDNTEKANLLINFINNLDSSISWSNIEICWFEPLDLKTWYFIVNENGCVNTKVNKLLAFLNSIYIEQEDFIVEYKTWRKDYILWRMLEDGYIDFAQYKQSIIGSFGFEFKPYIDEIKYPHFVMYVQDYLFDKYWEDTIKNGGFKIYTTIDSTLQDKAQELVEKQVELNITKFWAKNAALISLDNKTGEVLSLVWWVNYFDEENEGYNNMIFSRLQPWSTFKPFVYMLAMIKKWFTESTIFTDEKFTFPWDYTPNNSDWLYMWKITLSKAINYSRNIPAVKVYYASGEEEEIIKFLQPFGFDSLLKFKEEFKENFWYNYVYSAPMALWTVQITPFELAAWYSVFANSWIKNDIVFVSKIIDSSWEIIEEIDTEDNWVRILDQEDAYNINSILSNEKDRPSSWNYFLTIPDRKIAVKTWTSSKQYKKNELDTKETIAPMNLWTVWYTPQITTVVWAWNTSWEELKGKAYWLTWAWPIMRDFMTFAHNDLEVEEWESAE